MQILTEEGSHPRGFACSATSLMPRGVKTASNWRSTLMPATRNWICFDARYEGVEIDVTFASPDEFPLKHVCISQILLQATLYAGAAFNNL